MKNRQTNGFTLMELLIVLVIIGLLAALVGPNLYKRLKPAKQSVAKAQIKNFLTALDTFFVDNGRFPTTQEGLTVLTSKSTEFKNWNGPYLKEALPEDPWGNPYHYRSPGQHGDYEIITYGADGKQGGQGENRDINSWDSL